MISCLGPPILLLIETVCRYPVRALFTATRTATGLRRISTQQEMDSTRDADFGLVKPLSLWSGTQQDIASMTEKLWCPRFESGSRYFSAAPPGTSPRAVEDCEGGQAAGRRPASPTCPSEGYRSGQGLMSIGFGYSALPSRTIRTGHPARRKSSIG